MSAEQNTIEWKQERRGYITSSQVYRLMTEPKSKAAKEAGELSEGAKTYIMELIAEEIGIYKPDIETEAMRWGKEYEALAKYHLEKGVLHEKLVTPGFKRSIEGYGGSADAVGGDYIVEIKCPYNTAVHLSYCLDIANGEVPKEHYWQCVSNAFLWGCEKFIFATFDPRIDHSIGLMTITQRVNVDDKNLMIDKITRALSYKNRIKERLGIYHLTKNS